MSVMEMWWDNSMDTNCDGCCYNQKEENDRLGCNKIKCCYLNENKKECLVYENKEVKI